MEEPAADTRRPPGSDAGGGVGRQEKAGEDPLHHNQTRRKRLNSVTTESGEPEESEVDVQMGTEEEDDKGEVGGAAQGRRDDNNNDGGRTATASPVEVEAAPRTYTTLDEGYNALKAAMQATVSSAAVDRGTLTQSVFTRVYEASGIRKKPNKADEGYPELDAAEQDKLALLFGVSTIEANKDERAWRRLL
ncbi:hypothetical protein PybrP1_006473 [[Pythium] brassicae (nom. inval.)]|nr:hypothetical protein PybrP1_006473 [[Pythium] brassicae (nom. inval.)]